jgi:hypothetical protein
MWGDGRVRVCRICQQESMKGECECPGREDDVLYSTLVPIPTRYVHVGREEGARPVGATVTIGWTTQPLTPPEPISCPWCYTADPPVHVAGHVQCARCGQVIENCCGDVALPEKREDQPGGQEPFPATLDAS